MKPNFKARLDGFAKSLDDSSMERLIIGVSAVLSTPRELVSGRDEILKSSGVRLSVSRISFSISP